MDLWAMHRALADFIKKNWSRSLKQPAGFLKYRFLDPAAAYDGQLWDWDSFFCATALFDVYDDIGEYIEGCLLNFCEYARKDGSIPYVIYADESKSHALPAFNVKERGEDCDFNSAKPVLAQMAVLAYEKTGHVDFVKRIFPTLVRHIEHWENTQQKQHGLFVWRSMRGSGTDNHPAVYGRPLNASAAVELNCFMCLELEAMARLAAVCGETDKQALFQAKKEKLAQAINAHMWDPIDGAYYHLDMLSRKQSTATQDVGWDVPLKFRTWTCFVPMYARIAPPEYAKRLVKEHLTNPDEFWSDYGLRTLAKNEPVYTTVEISNPSNWQGPIWIVSTYILFKGLLNYGYKAEAEKVCENLLGTLCRDIEANGVLHEYYNPETGVSHILPGFMNWNALAGLMVPALGN